MTVEPNIPAPRKDKDGRKCYAVKVCYEKRSRSGSKPRSTCPAGDGNTLLLPPIDGQIQRVCCKSGCRKTGRCHKPRMRETREFHTDIQNDEWECRSKCDKTAQHCQTDNANKSCQRKLAESHCQTINGEVKQCGLQTSEIFSTCTKECQTDVDRACNAVGEAHNRKCCTKPCCKANRKCDTSTKARYAHNREFSVGGNQIARERKHVFPFVGRTPSGNLKVHPNMISYEHREFGVLVANPASIHTRVERVTGRCEKDPVSCPRAQLQSFPAPPPAPPCNFYPKENNNYRPTAAANTFHSNRPHPVPGFCKEDYATSSSPHPVPPPFSRENRSNFSDCPRENYKHYNRMPESIKVDGSNKTEEDCKSQDESGHPDQWNYVNPSYGKKQTHSSRYEETEFSTRENDRHSELTERSDRCSDGGCHRSGKTNPFDEEYLETGRNSWEEPNDRKDFHNYSYSDGSHKSGLSKRKPSSERESSNDARSPYAPPFPKLKPKSRKSRMSDSEYGTPIESEVTDDDTHFSREKDKTDLHHQHHHHHEHHRDEKMKKDSEMVGKLHYLLHGNIAQNTTIKIGDTEYPIHSVIFEIESKVIEPVTQHIPENIAKDVILPDLSELPHKYVYDSKLEFGKDESTKLPTEYAKQHEPPSTKLETTPEEVIVETEEEPAEEAWENVNVTVIEDDEIESTNFSLKDPDPVETLPPVPVTMSPDTKDRAFRIVEPNSDYNPPQYKPEPLQPVPPIPSVETNLTASSSEMEEAPVPKPRTQRSTNIINEERLNSVLSNLDTQRGAVLVVGGINPKLPCGPGNTGRDIYMYTIDADMWTHVGVLPHSRAHFGLVRIDTFIYVVGGTDPEQKDSNGKNLPVQSNLRLNLRTGEWDALPELKQPRSHFGCVAINRSIFVIGGIVHARASSTCLVFNIDNHSWKSITSLDIPRSNMGVAVLNNKILVAGGTTKSSKRPVLETVVCYDPSSDSWTAWKSLPTPRAFCSLGIVAGKVYIIGGAGIKDLSKLRNTSLADILRYEDVIKEWVEVASLYNPRHGHASAVSGENILIVGGVSSHFMGPLSSVEVFSTVSWEVSNGTSLTNSNSGLMAVTI
ncbi:Beta-scruin [Orchesella cincta]|uniref:Beta-scruin n=1 Tax=Orchesella cincta TaxID=48709 RepID=A0A1D2MGV4_ORCCI|nr:Beta-scruin [Orchesella cincta]